MTSKPTSHVTIACRADLGCVCRVNHGYLCLPSQWCCSTGISACQTGWGGFTDCTGWSSSICIAWGQPGTPPPHLLLCVLSLGAVGHLSTWNPTSWCNPGCSHVLLLFFPSPPQHNETTSHPAVFFRASQSTCWSPLHIKNAYCATAASRFHQILSATVLPHQQLFG